MENEHKIEDWIFEWKTGIFFLKSTQLSFGENSFG